MLGELSITGTVLPNRRKTRPHDPPYFKTLPDKHKVKVVTMDICLRVPYKMSVNAQLLVGILW